METKLEQLIEGSTIVITPTDPICSLTNFREKVVRYQESMQYIYQHDLFKRNLANTLIEPYKK